MRLTDTQLVILNVAAQHPNGITVGDIADKLPDLAKPKRAADALVKKGLLTAGEVRVGYGNPPGWRLTEAGMDVPGIDPAGHVPAQAQEPEAQPADEPAEAPAPKRKRASGADLAKLAGADEQPEKKPARDPNELTDTESRLLGLVRGAVSGMSHADMQQALGWNSECLSVLKRAAKKAGVELRSHKDGRAVLWFVEQPGAGA